MSGAVRVAVLGGGCGGLAAAMTLTATPELRERYSVTVYERSWRLGGKGASGRTPHGADGHRIEEHGLHIWFGFYERAFAMLRQAYEEAGIAAGDTWWQTAFDKCHGVSLYDRREDGSWVRQPVTLPPRGGRDAGPPTAMERPGLARATGRLIRMLALGLRSELADGERRRGPADPPADPALAAAVASLDDVAAELDRLDAQDGGPTRGIGEAVGGALGPAQLAALDATVTRLRTQVGAVLGGLIVAEDRLRLWGGVLDMLGATLTGIVRDELLTRGLGAIDGEDLRDWLARHGADRGMLDRTPVLRGFYDLAFAYEDGDKRRPSMAAGKGVLSLLMMVNYDGAFMWRMRAGMGDVVFAPLYLALRERGVAFEYFTRVDALRVTPDGTRVDAIDVVRTAAPAQGVYEPLQRVGTWECWPGAPLGDQLARAPEQPQRLAAGRDFDEVVLAIPVGAQPEICAALAAANPRYRAMLDGARTVRTKALQLWLTRPVDELRGAAAPALDPPATAYAEPFDTYCDMSHLLPVEGYGTDGPRGVAYFCAVLPDEVAEAEAHATVRSLAQGYVQELTAGFWPEAAPGGAFDWGLLYDPEDRAGPARLEAQYVRANTDASERYVTTPAGSVASRLDPGDSGFANLALAGDWTHNDIDGGCVEAAVISGERAGRALIERHP